MIKKMKRRMILAAMAAFFAVIMLIAILVNIVNYAVITKRSDETVRSIFENEKRIPPKPGEDNPPMMPPFMGQPNLEMNYMTRFFVVRMDENGKDTSVSIDYIASVDSDEAIVYANKVIKKGKDKGYIGEYRYGINKIGESTVIVFLNVARDRQYITSLLALTVVISLISLCIVFILVSLTSGKAIRPIARNIEQQKQFITDASHELKTPLTSMSTSVEVLEAEHGEDEWTGNIKTQISRLSKLVNELVTLSRLDEVKPIPNKERFSLSNAAWETVEIYKTEAKASEKNLSIDIEDDVFMIGDKTSVQQMLSVLLDNAIRYTDDKGDIRFSIFRKKNRINIEVFNTCRFDEIPDTNRLFDRFYRPDSSRSTKTGGTGVGLAIAKAVTETHGGTITATCPSGKSMTIKAVF
ncbi:MAG: GHKL domain-containing protein [Lachnospiraceae bacterium]|nr:GHKL domain-containing protein [Lachnospiraceae bacterium]